MFRRWVSSLLFSKLSKAYVNNNTRLLTRIPVTKLKMAANVDPEIGRSKSLPREGWLTQLAEKQILRKRKNMYFRLGANRLSVSSSESGPESYNISLVGVKALHEGTKIVLLTDYVKTLQLDASEVSNAEAWVHSINAETLPSLRKLGNDERVDDWMNAELQAYPKEAAPASTDYWSLALQAGGVMSAVLSFTPYRAWIRAGKAIAWAGALSSHAALVFSEEIQGVLPVLTRYNGKVKLPYKDILLGLYSSMVALDLQRSVNANHDHERHQLDNNNNSDDRITSVDRLSETGFFLKLAMIAYSNTKEEVQWLANSLGFTTVVSEPTVAVDRPAFALFVRENPPLAVISIRGSKTEEDWLTNIKFTSVMLDPNGDATRVCHAGMLKAATILAQDEGLANWVHKLRTQREIPVVLVGHSLGGGVATILSLLLRDNYGMKNDGVAEIRVEAFAPPACVSEVIAQECKGHVQAVFLGDDVVPRLSLTNVDALDVELDRTKGTWQKPMMASFGKLLKIAQMETLKAHQLGQEEKWIEVLKKLQKQFWRIVWWSHLREFRGERSVVVDEGALVGDVAIAPVAPAVDGGDGGGVEPGNDAVVKMEGGAGRWSSMFQGVQSAFKGFNFKRKRSDEKKEEEGVGSGGNTPTTTNVGAELEEKALDEDNAQLKKELAQEAAATTNVAAELEEKALDEDNAQLKKELAQEAAATTNVAAELEEKALDEDNERLKKELAKEASATTNVGAELEEKALNEDEQQQQDQPSLRLVPGGRLLHIYNRRGQYLIEEVDYRWQGLREIVCSLDMIKHHHAASILGALKEVIAIKKGNASEAPEWAPMTTADNRELECAISKRTLTELELATVLLTHCVACGNLCDERLCTNRVALPLLGILRNVQVCDCCNLKGSYRY